MPSRVLRFGAYEVDTAQRDLRKNGFRIKLQEQPFRILVYLLERPGEVVTRDELRVRLWPDDTFVEFDKALSTAANKLREALGDNAGNPRFIETIPRRGYRFIAPVQPGSPAAQKVDRAGQLRFVGIALLVMGAAGLGGIFSSIFGGWGKLHINSVAVLPMANLSPNHEQEYFADGMTDAVIAELARIGDLRVISRQSVMRYKGSATPLRQIGRELNVDAIVEGTVLQSGDRLRVTANLVQVATDSHLWAQQYDRDVRDVLSLQADIAHSIAGEVRIRLTPEQKALLAKPRPAVNPHAYELYLRGYKEWYKLTEEGLRKSAD